MSDDTSLKVETFQEWRDRMISTFPLDDMADEPRLIEAFDEAFSRGRSFENSPIMRDARAARAADKFSPDPQTNAELADRTARNEAFVREAVADAKAPTCKCFEIKQADWSRHFKGCPLRVERDDANEKTMQGWICAKCRGYNPAPSTCRVCGQLRDEGGDVAHMLARSKLIERHDLLRRRVNAIADHLELAAMVDEQESKFAEGRVGQFRKANAKFLRGEAELLHMAAEELEP